MKSVGLLGRLKCFSTRSSLLTVYKFLLRPYLDYGNVIYNQFLNATFFTKIESVQYNVELEACLVKNSFRNLD